MYITIYDKMFIGHPENDSLCNFFKISIVSDKMTHKAFRTRKTLFNKNH